MIIKKRFHEQNVRKDVIDNVVRTKLDSNTEFALLWKAIEELYNHLGLDLPKECQEFRDLIRNIKNQIKSDI